jgi:putative transposase
MHRAHKIRLNPTPDQAVYFRKAIGTARFAYNWALDQLKQALDAGKPLDSVLTLKKRFNAIKREQFLWVYQVTKCAVEGAFANLASALSNFRASKCGRRKGQRIGFPRFKRKKRGLGSFYLANDKFSLDGHWLIVPKLGRVNMSEPLRFAGKILGATISERAGWWWVSIQVDVPREPPMHAGHALGVDVGLKDLVVTSDGERFENQKPFRRAIGRVKRLQRTVSRRQKGSQNRAKAVRRLARAHYRVACLRADIQHKLTTRLAQQAAMLGIEDLNVVGMLVDRDLNAARNIRDEALRLSSGSVVATSSRQEPVDAV